MKNSNILDVKVKNYGECGYCKDIDTMIDLKVPWKFWSQWLYLTMKNHNKEWSAVFWVENDIIKKFKIPMQEVTAASVEFLEDLGGNGIIHSHHSMGAFHSGQDDKHERNLYEYSIVIDSKANYVSCKKVKLPCGGFGYIPCEITVTNMPKIEEDKIENKISCVQYGQAKQGKSIYDNSELLQHDIYDYLDEKEDIKEIPYDKEVPTEDYIPCDECTHYDCKNCEWEFTGYNKLHKNTTIEG